MTFVSDEHKQFYNDHWAIASKGNDYKALLYALGINAVCREHFFQIYDADECSIIPSVLHETWHTGSSIKIVRLAIHLFTWTVPPEDEPERYSPKELFQGLDDVHKEGVLLALRYFA